MALVAAVAGWLVFIRGGAPLLAFVVPVVLFLGLVVAHALLLERNERAARAKRLYVRGLDRMDGRWVGSGPDGARFATEHAYARDLDLFGPGSLFQLLTTARTEAGEETLATWLQSAADADEIRARQQAVAELRGRLDFREDLAVLAAETHVGRYAALDRGPHAGSRAAGGRRRRLRRFGRGRGRDDRARSCGRHRRLDSAGVWLLVQMGLVAIWRQRIREAAHRIEAPSLDLRLLVALLARVESETFASPKLTAILARLVRAGVKPSARLKRLQSFVSALDSMHNPLFAPFGVLLLVRSQAAVAIDRWHAANGPALAPWLDALGELEALSSFAAFAYERPEYPFPSIEAAGPLLDATALAHPLIVGHVAVPNDLRLGGGAPRVLVVSGSNMSGKSTLLRSDRLSTSSSHSPGRRCARARLRLSPLAIGATIRIEDSLQAGLSRFYAEILRIRAIVDAAQRGPRRCCFCSTRFCTAPTRTIGASAPRPIVRILVERRRDRPGDHARPGADRVDGTLAAAAANVHFEDRIENGKMVFDYRMRPGVVEQSNALELMRAVGLKV